MTHSSTAPSPFSGGGAALMPITTERIHLRSLTAQDLPKLWPLHADPRTFELDSTPPLDAVDQMERVLAVWLACARRDGIGYMLITAASGADASLAVPGATPTIPGATSISHRPASGRAGGVATAVFTPGEVLGVAGLSGMDVNSERVANLYVRLHPHAWGRGIAQEALRVQLDRLSMLQGTDEGPVGLREAHDAVIITAVQNTPMRTLAERLGFRLTVDQDDAAGFDHVLFRTPLRPTGDEGRG